MDIRHDKNRLDANIFTPIFFIIVSSLLTATIITGYYISIPDAILVSTLILCYVGISTTNLWSKELDRDGYASISHLYGGYFAALFLCLAIMPTLYLLTNSLISIIIGLFISLFYASIISSVAFRRIDEDKRDTAIETYAGPPVVYDLDGPYIEHTEQVAFEDRL